MRWSNGSEFPILVPKSSEEKPRGSKPLAQHDLLPKGFGIPLPSGVASVADWGRTIIKMKKYKDLNLSYEELIKMAESNGEHHRYLQWIQSNFSPANEDIHKVKMTPSRGPCPLFEEDRLAERRKHGVPTLLQVEALRQWSMNCGQFLLTLEGV